MIRHYGLDHGYSVTFKLNGMMLEAQWAPELPSGKTAKKLLPSYRVARDKYLAELAAGRGYAVLEV